MKAELPDTDGRALPPGDDKDPANGAGQSVPKPGEPTPPTPLSKEEQWAQFEKELKESDWGHQPC